MARKTKVTHHKGKIVKPVRKLRHWKQQFDKNAAFVWRKPVQWETTIFKPGQLVPEGLLPPVKIRRFWESGLIELAEFEDDRNVATGEVMSAEGSEVADKLESVKVGKGKWQVGEEMFKTKKAAKAYIDSQEE